jgi:DNA polymerase III delta subunit
MIYIVHGENIVKTRAQIANQQKKLKGVARVDLDVTQNTPEELENSLGAFGLFGEKPFVVLDATGLGRKKPDAFVEVLKKAPKEAVTIVFSGKSLSKANGFLKNAGELDAKVLVNEKDPDSNVFKFIDAVFSKNRKRAYLELRNLMKEEQNEIYILAMLVYNLRNIALVKFGEEKSISPFARTKSVNSAKKYTEEKVMELYGLFYSLDKKLKTGEIESEVAVPLAIEAVLN